MKFRCKRSGNITEFTNEVDIAELLKHPSYEEVKNEADEKDADEVSQKADEKAKKRRVLKLRSDNGTA